jgi:hypothetical protein
LAGGTVCREASETNLCDIEESCSGVDTYCPYDQAYYAGYTYKCGQTTFYCGIPREAILPVPEGDGTGFYFGDETIPNVCLIGTATNFYELTWPDCLYTYIENPCDNERPLENYGQAYCHPDTGNWDCGFVDIEGEDFFGGYFPEED